jgi:hypothetical protein
MNTFVLMFASIGYLVGGDLQTTALFTLIGCAISSCATVYSAYKSQE